MCAIKFWYKVAAITIASSGDWHTNPWHSSCFATLGDFITTAKSGECKPEDNLLLSAALSSEQKAKRLTIECCFCATLMSYLNGLKRIALSMFSGSVISGRKAAPPSDCDTTNFTADHTAIFWNGVTCGSRPLVKRTRKPFGPISSVPAFWFCACCVKRRSDLIKINS